jgi:hypothetical protein
MGYEIKSTAIMIDSEADGENAKKKFDFLKFSSDPYDTKRMLWDSDNADSMGILTHIFKNVIDSKTLTIKKTKDAEIDTIIRKAHKLRKTKEKEGVLDYFQLMFIGNGEGKSLIINQPQVSYIKDLRENKNDYFLFTIKAGKVREGSAAKLR